MKDAWLGFVPAFLQYIEEFQVLFLYVQLAMLKARF